MKHLTKTIFILSLSMIIYGCNEYNNEEQRVLEDNTNMSKIEFFFDINREAYFQSDYGEAPQIAIWLEYPNSSFYKTVWVTQRTGKNMWVGKVECLVSLPFWKSRNIIVEKSSLWQEIVDAVSSATKKEGTLKKDIEVPKNSEWIYFIEVNVSGDYNNNFPYWSDNGLPDTEGNGQPSIVFSGRITAGNNSVSKPVLIGRTSQHVVPDSLIKETVGITTAKELLLNIRVKS